MIKLCSATLLLFAALPTPAHALGGVGQPPPELKADKWYNSPPISLEDLKGKAVLIEVFRTW